MIKNYLTLPYLFILAIMIFSFSVDVLAFEPERDLEELSRLVSVDETPELLKEFGWALMYNNQISRAIPAFELALMDKPSDQDILEGLALCHQMMGDYKKAVKYISEMIDKNPESPLVEIYMNTLYILSEDAGTKDEMINLLESILLKDGKPNNKNIARMFLSRLYLEKGETEYAKEIFSELGFVSDWWVIGPFDNEGKTGFSTIYPPEEEINLNSTYKGKGFDVQWRKIPHRLNFGNLSFDSLIFPRDNTVAYSLVSVYSDVEQECVIRVGSSGAMKVFLNGEEIISSDVYRYHNYDQEIIPVVLKRGWNLVLLKVCTVDNRVWETSLRFTTFDGSPMEDLIFSTDIDDIEQARLQTFKEPSQDAWKERDRGARDIYDVLVYSNPENTMAHIYRGILESYYSYYDISERRQTRFYRKALDLRPDWAYIYYFIGLAEEEANTSRGLFEKAIELCPEANQSRMELGRYLYDIGRIEKASNIFKEIIERKPNYLEPRQYLAKIAWENGWYPVLKENVDELLKRESSYIFAYFDKALLEVKRGDFLEALDMYYKTLDLNFEAYYAREQLVDLLIQLGRVEEAVDVLGEYIDIHPYDVYSRIKMLKTYRKFEMFEQALSIADDILEINPRHYEALAWKGIILNRLGMKDETVKVFEEAIKYKKNYPFLSEYLGFIEPERKLYYDEYRYDVYDVLNELNVNLSEYYQDDAVYLFNQEIRRVWENGTSSFTRHKVIYIQTEKGVEDFTSIPILYSPEYEDVTIHNAKVIQPSGEELVTMRVYEYSTSDEYTRLYYDEVAKFIEFEGLQVGSIIDLEYTIDQTEENLFADYFGEVFYTGNKETTLRSEYILIVPETRRFYFNDVDEIEKISREVLPKDGEIVYTFRVDNVDGVISEPNMPSIIELIDKIKVTTFKSWDELAQWYWGLIKDQFRVNYKIKDVVKELTLEKKTEMEKVQSIYNYIVKEIRYVGLEFGIGGFKPREPIVCFNTKYGDCKDKGTLLITMLKEIGVEAKPVLIRTRSSGVIDMELPLLSNFNHYIVLANIDGEDVFLDPTAEFSGMNELPFSDQGVKVFVIDEGEGYFMETPVKGSEDNETSMDMRIWLSADGSAKATREVRYGDGDSAYQRSRFINKIKRKNIIEEYWSSIFPGTQVKDVDFRNIENYNENVSISYSLQIPELVRVSEDKYYLPTRIPEDDFLNQYASRSTRVYDLEIGQPFSITSRIEYIIPEGFRVIKDEFPLDIIYDSKFGEVVAKYEHKGDKLIADIDVTINVVRVSADDYIAFRHFLNEVDSREREEFILERVD